VQTDLIECLVAKKTLKNAGQDQFRNTQLSDKACFFRQIKRIYSQLELQWCWYSLANWVFL